MHPSSEAGKVNKGRSLEAMEAFHTLLSFLAIRLSPANEQLLCETAKEPPPDGGEWILQALWNEGRLRESSELCTEEGNRVEIIHPGTWNSEAGPDFLEAVIKLDGHTKRGAVEIHRHVNDWFAHGHDKDQRYRDVILHVVWNGNTEKSVPGQLPPCLELEGCLPSCWNELFNQLATVGYPYSRRVSPGGCALRAAEVDDALIGDFLTGAGLTRFRRKSRSLLDRALAAGFEQTAYEYFCEVMGYKVNREPFLNLARHLPLRSLQEINAPLSRLAVLLGSAGFLFDPTVEDQAATPAQRNLNRELWHRWWSSGMPPICLQWQKSGTRPANLPERRLIIIWKLLEQWNYRPLELWRRGLPENLSPAAAIKHLRNIFSISSDPEFSRLLKLTGAKGASLGTQRILDIAVNLLLPLMQAWANQQNSLSLQRWSEEVYLNLPRLQENQVTRKITHRLLVPASRQQEIVKKAVQQQGLQAVDRQFCQRFISDCGICPLSNQQMFAKSLAGN